MKVKRLLNKIKKTPTWVYLITIFCFITPFFLEDFFQTHDAKEVGFLFLFIPTFIWSYYLGLIGGLTGAILSSLIYFLGNEWILKIDMHSHNKFIMYGIPFINVTISLGVGVLADRLIKKEETIKRLAVTDPLTQLYNRRFILDSLKELKLKNADRVAVLFLDIDRFKYINDSYGHDFGDLLLQKIGERLRNTIDHEIVARIGGDEFVILFATNVKGEYIGKVAKDIINSFESPFSIMDYSIRITASIGISVYPENTMKLENLLNNADIAMYNAKREGKGRFQLYSQEMQNEFEGRTNVEQSIHRALENREFLIYYQPKFDVKTKKVNGLEALIRWMHPQKGLIPPKDFIPIAEQTGLIIPIGEWVIKTVCMQINQWQEKGYQPVRVSLNVSANQFDFRLVNTLKKAIKETNINPHLLEIEITESVLLQNLDVTASLLKQLNKLGIYTSIDDFGTGYSSLSYLNHLPVDCLKIDKSFVQDIHNEKVIIDSIITLGHKLNFSVLAEGIETLEQLSYLEQLQCDYGQGYILSPPVHVDKIERHFLARSQSSENLTEIK